MVRVGDGPDAAVVSSHGTYRRHQFLMLAAVKEWELTIEPDEALRQVARHARPEGTAPSRPLGLTLRIHDGVLAWQGVVDVRGEGVHTLIIAAAGARLIFHKFDRYQAPRDATG